jgi:hypothetical protein
LGLTHSNGYVLYADPNPLPTPDHYHDWYPFWDVNLGKPKRDLKKLSNGAYQRVFDNGVVIYNHYKNGKVYLKFKNKMKSAATGKISNSFVIDDRDGDIFLRLNK